MSGGPARCTTLQPPDRSGPPEARSSSSTARPIPPSSSGGWPTAWQPASNLTRMWITPGETETARFFQGLGLATQHGSASIPAAPAVIAKAAAPSPAQPVPPPPGQPSSSALQRRQVPQKRALDALLRLRFGAVEQRQLAGAMPKSVRRRRTRSSMSSRIGRTASTDWPAGSGNTHSS
jgi:hypothetical protein